MVRLNIFLMLAVMASALYLVHTQYESRRLYVELEKAAVQTRKLVVENERLQVEKRAQATPLRVEKLAKERLQMSIATPAITQYVAYTALGATTSTATATATATAGVASASGSAAAAPTAKEVVRP